MALVTVRPKDDPKAQTLVVDEAWVARWPDDFDVVENAEQTAEHAAVSTTVTPKQEDAGDGDTSTDPAASRSRF